MFILHLPNRNAILFIHIPKCAGVMVRRQCKAIGMKKYLPFQSFWGIHNDIDMAHIPLAYALHHKPDLMDIIDDPEKTLTPFTIVRNPYDRLYSGFQFEKTANWIPQNPLYYDDSLDFNTFIEQHLPQILKDQNERFERKQSLSLAGVHFARNTLMLRSNGNEMLCVKENNILKQENVTDEFSQFMLRVGAFEDDNEYNQFIRHLKPENCSNHNAPPKSGAYTQYYSAKSIEIVNDLYGDDFERFGYTMIDPETHDTKKLLKGVFWRAEFRQIMNVEFSIYRTSLVCSKI
eukprot:1168587_1